MKKVTRSSGEHIIKKFERLVKNPKKDNIDILRAYWDYGRDSKDFNACIAQVMESLLWKHRRKVWYYKEFEWDKLHADLI